jgi:uncharacterized repeat protein (TIGR02543 family)
LTNSAGFFISGDGSNWASPFGVGSNESYGISCGSPSFCAMADSTGHVFTSTTPTVNGSWNGADVDNPNQFNGIGCHSAYLCVAVDNVGNAVVGTAPPPLSVTVAGSGSGGVTGGGISCPGAACQQSYPYNTPVTLTAAAAAGSTFAGWGGSCSGTATCSVTMNDAQNVTATFTAIPVVPTPPHTIPPPSATKITKATISSRKRTAKFTYTASGSVTSYQCALIKLPSNRHRTVPAPHYAVCTSAGRTYKKLARARYEFLVRAVGPGGTDPKPAHKTFTI